MMTGRCAIRLALLFIVLYGATSMAAETTRYVRYAYNNHAYYGIENGDRVDTLDGRHG